MGEAASEQLSLRAFAANHFGGRRQSRGELCPVFSGRAQPGKKGGSSRVPAQSPFSWPRDAQSWQRGRSILAKGGRTIPIKGALDPGQGGARSRQRGTLDPSKGGRSIPIKGALNPGQGGTQCPPCLSE